MSALCPPSSSSPSSQAVEPIRLRGAAGYLLQCRDEEVLLEGRTGTGKSIGGCYKALWCAQSYTGSRILLARETRRSMTDSILVTLESMIGKTHPEVTRCNRDQRHSYRLWGSEIVCAGMDEPSKVYGTGWDLIYLNEAIESSLDAWELFGRGARDPEYRRGGSKRAMPYQQRIADLNPGWPNFWANRRATDCSDKLRKVETLEDYQALQAYNSGPQNGKMRRLVSVHQDNPTWFDFKTWSWWPEGNKQRQIILNSMSGPRLKRMFYGMWVTAEGSVFPEFDADQHVIAPFAIPSDWPCIVAKDPGRDHPDATILAAVAPTGRLYLVTESVVRQTTTEQDAKALNELCKPFNVVKKLGDPHYMFSNTKMSDTGRTIAQQMRDFGHVFEPAPAARNQAEIAQQVEMIRTLLATRGADGEPMLQVFRGCAKTINGFQSWGYVRNTKGEMSGGEDKFEDIGDDEMDCVRMIVASRPQFAAQDVVSLGSAINPVTRTQKYSHSLVNGRDRWTDDDE